MEKTVFIIALLTVISKITGFGREIALSYYYGTSYVSDAFLVSMMIPSVIFSIITAGLHAGFIPIYSTIQKNENECRANEFTNNLINIILVICTITIIFCCIFTQPIVQIFASGFEGKTLEIGIDLTRISLLSIYSMGLMCIFVGFLQIHNSFISTALVAIPSNLLIIVTISISFYTRPEFLAIGYVVSTGAQLVFLYYYVQKKQFFYKARLPYKDKYVTELIYIIIPLTLGTSVHQINQLIDRTIASQLNEGAISAMGYADRINAIILSIIVLSISAVLYPALTNCVAMKDIQGFKEKLQKSIRQILIVIIPGTIFIMVFSEQIVRILFGHGAFDNKAVKMTSSVLFFYVIGLLGVSLREILTKAFYAFKNTKTPMINATIGLIINIILNIILSKYMGVSGLALATSISATCTTVLLFVHLRKRIGKFGISHLIIIIFKSLLATLIMIIMIKKMFTIIVIFFSEFVSLVIISILGFIIYVFLSYIFNIMDIKGGIDYIWKKLKRID